ncbi:putative membrane protein [Peptoniphilus sp. ING2-D1G]|nr:putative membrane protein [Peptoniphilus sp. ING2-D1G]
MTYWPIILVVISNLIYHICAKSMPEKLNPFAALTVAYAIGMVVSAILFLVLNPQSNLLNEYKNLNWTSFVMGVFIVGIEVGYMYLYKSGWNINTGYIVVSIALAASLVIVGYFLYEESLSITKLMGIILCTAGVIMMRN